MRLRFSIRDLLWLTLMVGMAIGWWIDHQSQQSQLDENLLILKQAEKQQQSWRAIETLRKKMELERDKIKPTFVIPICNSTG